MQWSRREGGGGQDRGGQYNDGLQDTSPSPVFSSLCSSKGSRASFHCQLKEPSPQKITSTLWDGGGIRREG